MYVNICCTIVAMDTEGAPDNVADVLRDLAWTVHRTVPHVAGLEPLPTTELAVLKHVLDSPGITVTELARSVGLRQSNASAAVRVLVERGLVHREPSPTDRRQTLLVTTDRARSDDAVIREAWSGEVRSALSRLDHADVAVIEAASGALDRLDALLRGTTPAGPDAAVST